MFLDDGEHPYFGDFGTVAPLDKEYPYGDMTGTLTVWDITALGKVHGEENGFDIENDIFGLVSIVLDALVGYPVIERMLDAMDPNWETEPSDQKFTDLVRACRLQMSGSYIKSILQSCRIGRSFRDLLLTNLDSNRTNRMTAKELSRATQQILAEDISDETDARGFFTLRPTSSIRRTRSSGSKKCMISLPSRKKDPNVRRNIRKNVRNIR